MFIYIYTSSLGVLFTRIHIEQAAYREHVHLPTLYVIYVCIYVSITAVGIQIFWIYIYILCIPFHSVFHLLLFAYIFFFGFHFCFYSSSTRASQFFYFFFFFVCFLVFRILFEAIYLHTFHIGYVFEKKKKKMFWMFIIWISCVKFSYLFHLKKLIAFH